MLLDHQDWMAGHAPEALQAEWELILRNSQPRTRILFHSAGTDHSFLPGLARSALRFRPDLSDPLHRKDRVGTYGSLHMTSQLETYYRNHAKIYDATRWSFLFGRRCRPFRILEIGCGTGKNLAALARWFPEARVTGMDLSSDMFCVAKKTLGAANGRVRLIHMANDRPINPARPFDLIAFSYTFSMINPGWRHAIRCAAYDLAPGGTIAALDFHDSPFPWFKTWMGLNRVRMDSHLLPVLSRSFRPAQVKIRRAYAGAWTYFFYIGRKRQA